MKHTSTKLLLATTVIVFLLGVFFIIAIVYSLVAGMPSSSETSIAPIAGRTMRAALSTQTEIGTPTPTPTATASSEQIAFMTYMAYVTKVAQTQEAATMYPVTPIPLGQFLPPSGEWKTYTDPTFGYSFEYPPNWFVSNNGSSTSVENLDGVIAKPSLNALSIWISPEKDFASYGSLEACLAAYLAEPEHAVPPDWIISQTSRTLPRGYEVLEIEKRLALGTGALIIFLTNGTQLYEIGVVDITSHYIAVAEHVLNSFIIPE